jgi:zinc finger protein
MVESTEKPQATPDLEETKDSAVSPADTSDADKQTKRVTEAQAGSDLTKLYIDLEDGVPTEEIESLCMECRKSGVTRFMYTKIPMFREIILSSFSCEHCGNRNTEVQFSGKLSDTGVKYSFTVTDEKGLNRSVVKSEFATIRIPELDFEIPPQTQKGSIKTIEGFFLTAIEGISEL